MPFSYHNHFHPLLFFSSFLCSLSLYRFINTYTQRRLIPRTPRSTGPKNPPQQCHPGSKALHGGCSLLCFLLLLSTYIFPSLLLTFDITFFVCCSFVPLFVYALPWMAITSTGLCPPVAFDPRYCVAIRLFDSGGIAGSRGCSLHCSPQSICYLFTVRNPRL